MRTVEDDRGTRYLLVKRSGETSLVRDPETGAETYVPNDALTPADDGPLETAARAVPESTRSVLTATRDERALGLLVELRRRGPTAVRDLLDAYDLCESDLLGAVSEFRAAGLVEEVTVAGEPGYRLTAAGERALDDLVS